MTTTWKAEGQDDTCNRGLPWRCHRNAVPATRITTVIDGRVFEGNWRPTKYATRRFPPRVENGIYIETLVEMYHGAPTPYDNRYSCRVTNKANGHSYVITDCDSAEIAERLALGFLK